MLNTALIIGLGIVCLILTVLALIFGVIALANNKPSKFLWLILFLSSLVGLILCIFIVVRKVAHAVQDYAVNAGDRFEAYSDSLNGGLYHSSAGKHEISPSSPQIKVLKSYLAANILNNEPEEFYSYAGFKDYRRFPLRYPFSIHTLYANSPGELYNEVNVKRFDENDNGEIYLDISNIVKIAFDRNYLLIEQEVSSTRTDKLIKHFLLFDFETQKKEEASSLPQLIKLARDKGYGGSDTLMTLEQYHHLF
ncbi:MAG: hypothetical protein K0R26_253 [Bacteroidota bacterium]|jgi:hypothetical protein|nr:hypothetical protein [Bacteroidota bacterium]